MNFKWEEGIPTPVQCYGHTAVFLNGMVYVGGGIEPLWRLSYIINCYDPVNNSWSYPVSTPYCHFAMTTLSNKLLIAGGHNKYNKKTNQTFTMAARQLNNYTNMITARSHAVAAGHQEMLIITGGKDDKGDMLSCTELFDTKNGQWYMSNNLPEPHCWLKSVIVDNILYLLGGSNKDGRSPAVFTAPLDTLSAHQLKWSTNQDTPWCRSAPVSVNGTNLLIIGGNKLIENKQSRTSNIYKLNKITHSWEVIGHIPSATSSSAAVSTADNSVIVIGGVIDSNDRRRIISTVWIGSCEPQW